MFSRLLNIVGRGYAWYVVTLMGTVTPATVPEFSAYSSKPADSTLYVCMYVCMYVCVLY